MNSSNFIILKNEYDLIYKDTNNPILLVGLNNQTKDENSINNAYSYFNEPTNNQDIYSITLTHEPDTVDLIDPNIKPKHVKVRSLKEDARNSRSRNGKTNTKKKNSTKKNKKR